MKFIKKAMHFPFLLTFYGDGLYFILILFLIINFGIYLIFLRIYALIIIHIYKIVIANAVHV
jgi:hypothetical protein